MPASRIREVTPRESGDHLVVIAAGATGLAAAYVFSKRGAGRVSAMEGAGIVIGLPETAPQIEAPATVR